jgi:hypothetical protein
LFYQFNTMIIQERNTKKFKDIINTIAINMGYVELVGFSKKANKISHNFNANGSIKTRRYAGIGEQTDIIAMFYKQTTETNATIQFIRLGDYLSFVRDMKVSDVVGDKVEIVEKPRKIRAQKEAEFQPTIRGEYGVDCGRNYTYNVCVVKRTPSTITCVKDYNNEEVVFRLSKEGVWYKSPYTMLGGNHQLIERPYTTDELERDESTRKRASLESWYD